MNIYVKMILIKEKSRKKKESRKKIQKGGSKEFPYLPLSLVNDYEKMAEHYNISRKARGLEKPTTSDKGFLVVYREVKGNADKLKSIPVRKDKETNELAYHVRWKGTFFEDVVKESHCRVLFRKGDDVEVKAEGFAEYSDCNLMGTE